MALPERFFARFREFFPDEYDAFVETLEQPPYRGIRVNTLKTEADELVRLLGGFLELRPVPFCGTGFYIPADIRGLGNHPLHVAGAFYMQEPSAMAAVGALAPQPGERVLDLCAAPGGKSSQIAAALRGEGILVANDFVESRARVLSSNLERMGADNCLVTSMRPDALCQRLSGWFDRVLVDAPCSGEGMLRREPSAAENWSEENIRACAHRQAKILDSAARAVRPGGWLCYSTCTFAPEEDEQTVAAFLHRHPDFFIADIPGGNWGQPGRPYLAPSCPGLEKTRRIFPRLGGEGHFVALMRKGDDAAMCVAGANTSATEPTARVKKHGRRERYVRSARADDQGKAVELFMNFWRQTFYGQPLGNILPFENKIFLTPSTLPPLEGLRVLRAGLPAGEATGKRFIPAHALFASPAVTPRRMLDFSPDAPALRDFLQGAEIAATGLDDGYAGVRVCGMALGFGKVSGSRLKNHYPKGLRLREGCM